MKLFSPKEEMRRNTSSTKIDNSPSLSYDSQEEKNPTNNVSLMDFISESSSNYQVLQPNNSGNENGNITTNNPFLYPSNTSTVTNEPSTTNNSYPSTISGNDLSDPSLTVNRNNNPFVNDLFNPFSSNPQQSGSNNNNIYGFVGNSNTGNNNPYSLMNNSNVYTTSNTQNPYAFNSNYPSMNTGNVTATTNDNITMGTENISLHSNDTNKTPEQQRLEELLMDQSSLFGEPNKKSFSTPSLSGQNYPVKQTVLSIPAKQNPTSMPSFPKKTMQPKSFPKKNAPNYKTQLKKVPPPLPSKPNLYESKRKSVFNLKALPESEKSLLPKKFKFETLSVKKVGAKPKGRVILELDLENKNFTMSFEQGLDTFTVSIDKVFQIYKCKQNNKELGIWVDL